MFRTFMSLILVLVLAVPLVAGPLKSPAPEDLWADLASADEATFARALLALSKTPRETVAFLKDNLPPVKADPAKIAKLIAELDSNQFTTREKAVAELEYLGKYIKDDLEKALAKADGIETKQRLQQLLDKMPKPVKDPKAAPPANPNGASVQVIVVNGQRRVIVNGVEVDGAPRAATPTGPPATWVRAVRAIALLEHIGGPEARQVLESLASGEADALPTQQAKAALERLAKP
jgi:hypothetical protein